jgi:hypothetical protein
MTNLKRRSFIAGLATAPFALKMISDGRSADSNFQKTSSDARFVNSTVTTDLNLATATAIISLRGLGMGCFGQYGYESGFVPHPPHVYRLQIKELGPGATTPIRPPLLITGNIRFDVINPLRPGVFRYENGSFMRPNGSTDEQHFGWILDMEGPEMHNEKLELIPLSVAGVPPLRKVLIPHATFYTRSLSDYVYSRVNAKRNAKERGVMLGRIAGEMGAAIHCEPRSGSGIRLTVERGRPLFLPWRPDLKYDITLRNLRPEDKPHMASDFPVYYTVLRDPDGDEYNIAHVVGIRVRNKRDMPRGSVKIQDTDDVDLVRHACCGLACDKVVLSRTSSLEQPA